MKIEKSDSLKMKHQALCWLRLSQRCMFIATEVGGWNADVLGINEEKMVEIEIKCSFEDFKNDFRKPKHRYYGGHWTTEWENQWVPTHFYFAVTPDLIEKAKAYLKEREESFPKVKAYGIISMDGWKVEKRAQRLHDGKPNNRVKCTTALRMGSELIRFHEAWL